MKVTIPVRSPEGRMELWDIKLQEISVMLKIPDVANKPKVIKMSKQNFL